MKNIVSLVFGVLLLNSCVAQWGKKINGNGIIITIERSVGDYEAVDMAGFYDVKFVAGTEGNLTIEGEENLLPHLVTEVKDGKLVLKTEKGYSLKTSARSGIKITVPVKEIGAVYLSGSGDISSRTTLKADSFTMTISGSGAISLDLEVHDLKTRISGSGEINLSGKASFFDVSISGSGDMEAYDLEAKNVNVNVSGSGDITITATEHLKARVSGSGAISYRGNPVKVDSKSSGSGDISKSRS